MLGQNGSITVSETTDFWLQSGKIANFAGGHLHDYLQIGCTLAMTGVISCGRDHCGKVAQKTVGPSKYLHHTLMVHPLGSHVFWGFFCYLFCYIKEDSQAILLFCLVWSVFVSIRDMLPIRVIWFWYCVTVRATFPPVNYFIVPPLGSIGCFFCRIIFPLVYINVNGSSFRQINWGCSTLESGINVALGLLIFWLFSRGYGLIPDFIV